MYGVTIWSIKQRQGPPLALKWVAVVHNVVLIALSFAMAVGMVAPPLRRNNLILHSLQIGTRQGLHRGRQNWRALLPIDILNRACVFLFAIVLSMNWVLHSVRYPPGHEVDGSTGGVTYRV